MLYCIQGEPGDNGDKGPRGDKGLKGRRGMEGEDGPKGQRGPLGDQGEPVSPLHSKPSLYCLSTHTCNSTSIAHQMP